MSKEKESKKESTELQKGGGAAVEMASPFRFVKQFAEDMERLFEDVQGFRAGGFFGGSFFRFPGN